VTDFERAAAHRGPACRPERLPHVGPWAKNARLTPAKVQPHSCSLARCQEAGTSASRRRPGKSTKATACAGACSSSRRGSSRSAPSTATWNGAWCGPEGTDSRDYSLRRFRAYLPTSDAPASSSAHDAGSGVGVTETVPQRDRGGARNAGSKDAPRREKDCVHQIEAHFFGKGSGGERRAERTSSDVRSRHRGIWRHAAAPPVEPPVS
jgi:hypothetical protein